MRLLWSKLNPHTLALESGFSHPLKNLSCHCILLLLHKAFTFFFRGACIIYKHTPSWRKAVTPHISSDPRPPSLFFRWGPWSLCPFPHLSIFPTPLQWGFHSHYQEKYANPNHQYLYCQVHETLTIFLLTSKTSTRQDPESLSLAPLVSHQDDPLHIHPQSNVSISLMQ